jgi:hypothetical protein
VVLHGDDDRLALSDESASLAANVLKGAKLKIAIVASRTFYATHQAC